MTFLANASVHKIAAVVGDHVITEYELDQRVRFMMFMQNIKPKEHPPTSLYSYFLNAIIDNDLVLSRIEPQVSGSIKQEDINQALAYVAKTRLASPEQVIKEAIQVYGMTKESFLESIKNDMMIQMALLSPLAGEAKITEQDLLDEAKRQEISKPTEAQMSQIRGALVQRHVERRVKEISQNLRQTALIEIKLS